MLEYIALLTPYVIPALNLILAVRVFRYTREKDRRNDTAEQRTNDAPLPPRSKRHKR